MSDQRIRIRGMENELRMWWLISNQIRALSHNRAKFHEKLRDLCEEAECIVKHTDWVLLRTIIAMQLVDLAAQLSEIAEKAVM